nr:hypothetical protein [Cryobacterium sp. SO1]
MSADASCGGSGNIAFSVVEEGDISGRRAQLLYSHLPDSGIGLRASESGRGHDVVEQLSPRRRLQDVSELVGSVREYREGMTGRFAALQCG